MQPCLFAAIRSSTCHGSLPTTPVGQWVRITNADRATSSKNRYCFRRAGGRFEQVTAYHAIDAQQHNLRSVGFTDVNAESEKVEVNAFAAIATSDSDPSAEQALTRGQLRSPMAHRCCGGGSGGERALAMPDS
jgi:hypothetical protein